MRSLLRTRYVLVALLVFSISASADVAPDPGYKYIPVDLILKPTQDLSSFRFFLLSPADLEEVRVVTGSPTMISAKYRGGVNLYGQLLAVPVSEIGSDQPDQQDPDGFKNRYRSAYSVLSHTFKAEVSIIEEPFWKPPEYTLSLDGGVVRANKVSSESGRSLMMYAIPVVAAGVLITIGIAILGLWLFRRSRKKV